MDFTMKHLGETEGRCIHLFTEDYEAQHVTRAVTLTAREWNLHLAILQGSNIVDKRTLLIALAEQYNFPADIVPDRERLNWDGVTDFMRDLSWLIEPPQGTSQVRGFILLYLNPAFLFSEEPIEFALFLETINHAAREHNGAGMPFYLVAGPVDFQMLRFVGLLRVSDNVCWAHP